MSYEKSCEDVKLETRPLTQEIADALEVPNAAFITAFDISGKPIRFERPNPRALVLPMDEKARVRIKSLFTTTFIAYEGSDCAAQVDSTGSGSITCLPW